MRELAAWADGDHRKNHALVQLLAGQVVARAAYTGQRFQTLDEIKRAVFEVAGYPMLNPMEGGILRPESNVGDEAAYRVASLIGLKIE